MWRLRCVPPIALAHGAALLAICLVFLLGDTLLAGYATLVRDAIPVRDAAQASWLQRMGADVQGAVAYVVAVSTVSQSVLCVWRRQPAAATVGPRHWAREFTFVLARALRGVGIGLAVVASVSILESEVRQSGDLRTYALVAAATLSVSISHWFTSPPQSTGGS